MDNIETDWGCGKKMERERGKDSKGWGRQEEHSHMRLLQGRVDWNRADI